MGPLDFDMPQYIGVNWVILNHSQGTKVGKMLTLAPERYTYSWFCIVAKAVLWYNGTRDVPEIREKVQ